MIPIKCLGNLCPAHWTSDIYEFCKVTSEYMLEGQECNGINEIFLKKKSLHDQIYIMKNKIKELNDLEIFLKENQERTENNITG